MGSQPQNGLRLRGLFTGKNPYEIPDGSLFLASKNVFLRAPGELVTRPGLQRLHRGSRYEKILPYDTRLILALVGGGFKIVSSDYSGVPQSIGAGNPPSTGKVQAAVAGNRWFATTSESVRVLDSSTPGVAALRDAGGAIAPGGELTSFVVGTNWLADLKRVAYRYTIGRQTDTGVQIIGPPSGRLVVTNNAGAPRDVLLRLLLPPGLTTDSFIQVWRSGQVDPGVQPDDDLQLVYERAITTFEASTGVVSFTDVVPDALRGEFLYTSPNAAEGIEQSNWPPPRADTIILHKDRLWLGSTKQREEFYFRILAVGAGGLAVNDQIVITGPSSPLVYTAGTSFTVATGGSASQNIEQTAQNLVFAINADSANSELWARYVSGPDEVPGEILLYGRNSITPQFAVWTDQQSTSAAWSARTAYAPQLPPLIEGSAGTRQFTLTRFAGVVTATVTAGNILGMLVVGESITILTPPVSFGAGPFVVTGVTGTTFTYAEAGINTGPSAAITVQFAGGTPNLSSAESFVNRVHYSKPFEFEAFPLGQFADIGASDKAIIAMASTRETLWVFKEDGLFRITGDDESTFDVERTDATILALSRECVVPFAESVVAWTNKGVMLISESSIDIISDDIASVLRDYVADATNSSSAGCFGKLNQCFIVADDREGLIRLHLAGSSVNVDGVTEGAGEALVWCRESESWSRWAYDDNIGVPKALLHGVVNPFDRRVYYCDGTRFIGAEGFLWVERLNTALSTVYQDTDQKVPTGDNVAIATRAMWHILSGGAPMRDKRWDEVSVLIPKLFGTSTFPTPFAYGFANENSQAPNSAAIFGMAVPTDWFDTLTTAEPFVSPNVRFMVSNDQTRGQQLIFFIEKAIILEPLELHSFDAAFEVLNEKISR